MTSVLLIDMPFGDIHCPSLALGLFKSRLERDGITCDVANLKLLFAKMVGWDNYLWQSALTGILTGERAFARTFFGSDVPSDAEYAQFASQYLKPADIQRLQGISAHVEPFLRACMDGFPWERYDVIGFTSMFEQNVPSLALAYEIKRRFPKKVIVLGGANCEGEMGATLHRCFPFIDYVCSGEADNSFPALINRLGSGKPVEDIPGIVYRESGSSHYTGAADGLTEMNELPFPNYDDYFSAAAAYGAPWLNNRTVPVEASRGCWWGAKVKCTFCGLNGTTIDSRAKSANRVMDEIAWLVDRYNVNYIRMVDNMLNPDFVESLLPEIERRNSGVRFFFEIRPTLRKEQVKLLAQAGVSDIQAGIENLSTDVLRFMKKGSTTLSGIQTLKWCKQYGVYADWNILYGFPGEKPAHYQKNFELAQLLTHLNPPGAVGPFRMDRFSTNFEQAGALGFEDVRPLSPYRFVYPYSENTLKDLAYFFEYKLRDQIDDGGYVPKLSNEVAGWKARKDQLTCAPVNGSLEVYDTRPVASASRMSLQGLKKDVIEYCDRAHTLDQLHGRLKAERKLDTTKEEIQEIL
ncbi:MAG TPA: RiPP maturation radical SAM C-methyltransferase, partial [Blastocatellia bacterium]|nr:RiPP maturation radical SAM C-methyltransferase [Blastocatellia bacterium]